MNLNNILFLLEWRLLEHREQENYTVERFINAVSTLKGNIKERIEKDSLAVLPDTIGIVSESEQREQWPELSISK